MVATVIMKKQDKLSYKIYTTFMENDVVPLLKEHGMTILNDYHATTVDGDCTYHFDPRFTSYPKEDVGGLIISVDVTFESLKSVMLKYPYEANRRPREFGYGGPMTGILPRPLQNPYSYIWPNADAVELGAVLRDQIKRRVFPFYDYFSDISNVISSARSGNPFTWNQTYLAATLWLRGDRNGAETTLLEWQSKLHARYVEDRKYHDWKSIEDLAIFAKALEISLPEFRQ